jgi:hypothetical protein
MQWEVLQAEAAGRSGPGKMSVRAQAHYGSASRAAGISVQRFSFVQAMQRTERRSRLAFLASKNSVSDGQYSQHARHCFSMPRSLTMLRALNTCQFL